MEKLIKKHAEKLRFGAVGGANTALDFGILFVLVFLGVDKIFANFVSTSTAFVFSFFANRSFTFKLTTKTTKKQIGLFVVITLFGLWIIQPIIITEIGWMLNDFGPRGPIVLLIGKVCATVVTLVWNYVLYRKFVFTKTTH